VNDTMSSAARHDGRGLRPPETYVGEFSHVPDATFTFPGCDRERVHAILALA
jgi:hypothetical protein